MTTNGNAEAEKANILKELENIVRNTDSERVMKLLDRFAEIISHSAFEHRMASFIDSIEPGYNRDLLSMAFRSYNYFVRFEWPPRKDPLLAAAMHFDDLRREYLLNNNAYD